MKSYHPEAIHKDKAIFLQVKRYLSFSNAENRSSNLYVKLNRARQYRKLLIRPTWRTWKTRIRNGSICNRCTRVDSRIEFASFRNKLRKSWYVYRRDKNIYKTKKRFFFFGRKSQKKRKKYSKASLFFQRVCWKKTRDKRWDKYNQFSFVERRWRTGCSTVNNCRQRYGRVGP